MFKQVSDNPYLTKEEILQKISQEQIFQLVFGKLPKQYEYVCSPFRKDTNPGAYFEYDEKEILRFIDFANTSWIKGIDCRFLDCFSAIQIFYNLSFTQAISYINQRIFEKKIKKELTKLEISKNIKRAKNSSKKTILVFSPRIWLNRDRDFWYQYGIKIKDLKKDFVFPVEKFSLLNTKTGNHNFISEKLSYCYTDFSEEKKQIYQPEGGKKSKFFMSCTANNIFGIKKVDITKDIIITKSYKDWRVLKNCGFNAVAFINEGMVPEYQILEKLFIKNPKVYIFFDSDNTGKKASEAIKRKLQTLFPKLFIDNLCSPYKKYKDPSDIVKYKSEKELKEIIYDHKRKYQ